MVLLEELVAPEIRHDCVGRVFGDRQTLAPGDFDKIFQNLPHQILIFPILRVGYFLVESDQLLQEYLHALRNAVAPRFAVRQDQQFY